MANNNTHFLELLKALFCQLPSGGTDNHRASKHLDFLVNNYKMRSS